MTTVLLLFCKGTLHEHTDFIKKKVLLEEGTTSIRGSDFDEWPSFTSE